MTTLFLTTLVTGLNKLPYGILYISKVLYFTLKAKLPEVAGESFPSLEFSCQGSTFVNFHSFLSVFGHFSSLLCLVFLVSLVFFAPIKRFSSTTIFGLNLSPQIFNFFSACSFKRNNTLNPPC